jgi:pyruvate/2-oxoglutarate dehydrogenase complex dihydrolipoamide acyltransferase (E2) component
MVDGSIQVRDVMNLGFTADERIADGFYFARSLKLAEYILTNPSLLDIPLSEEIDYAY